MEDNPTLFGKLKFVNEKATLFRITANAMISVSETMYSFECFFFWTGGKIYRNVFDEPSISNKSS